MDDTVKVGQVVAVVTEGSNGEQAKLIRLESIHIMACLIFKSILLFLRSTLDILRKILEV